MKLSALFALDARRRVIPERPCYWLYLPLRRGNGDHGGHLFSARICWRACAALTCGMDLPGALVVKHQVFHAHAIEYLADRVRPMPNGDS